MNNDKAEEWEGTPTNLLQELGAYSDYGLDFSTLTNDFQFDAFQSTFIPAFATTQGSLLGNTNNVHISLKFAPKHYGRGSEYDSIIISSLGTFASNDNVCAAVKRPGGGIWLCIPQVCAVGEPDTTAWALYRSTYVVVRGKRSQRADDD